MRNPQSVQKSVLKYAGGKQRLVAQLLPYFPEGRRLVEPFLGGGSIFLNTAYPTSLLADANPDLIAFWVALKERPRDFVQDAAAFFAVELHSESAYLAVRAEYNASTDRYERAVRFPYLNRFGFNGMYRVNRRGDLNIPYGRPKSLPKFPFDAAEHAAKRLQSATVLSGGFIGTMAEAGTGDVIYCDPPYASAFTSYTQAGFGHQDQQALVQAARRAASRGAHVLISNHDTPYTRDLYDSFEVMELTTRRSVAARSSSRGVANELLAILRPA